MSARKPKNHKTDSGEEIPNELQLNERISVLCADQMEVMPDIPDGYYNWAVIDPPYGLDKKLITGGGKMKNTPMSVLYKGKEWDVLPGPEYWKHIFRISKNQCVFGANYFFDYLRSTRGIVFWDKKNDMPSLSAGELVWTSLDKPAKICKAVSTDNDRFHPTQKPVYLYRFMYQYCGIQPGEKLIDVGFGSGNCLVAANQEGLTMDGIEGDKEYYDAFVKNFRNKAPGHVSLFAQ